MKFKLTTKSYKRKLVTYGILLFSGISLLSTGFAAWVVSQGSKSEGQGNVNVGIIQDKSTQITDLVFIADSSRTRTEDGLMLTDPTPYTYEDIQKGVQNISFIFDARFDDKEGMIKGDQSGESRFESLNITVKGSVTNATSLDKLTMSLELPKGVKECVNKGYIVAPDGSYYKDEEVQSIDIEVIPHETDVNKVNFSFDLEFKWGSAFLGMNPGLYFDKQGSLAIPGDELTIPQDASFNEVNAVLNELRGLMLNVESKDTVEFDGRVYKTYDKDALEKADSEKFKITLNAIAK